MKTTKQILGRNARLLTVSAALLTWTLTVSAQTLVTTTLVNDTGYAGAGKDGSTVTLASGAKYYALNANSTDLNVSGANITIANNYGGVPLLYRPFDADGENQPFTIKLSSLQAGESLSLSFKAAITANTITNASSFSFGFTSSGVGSDTNPIYVLDNLNSNTNTAFAYRHTGLYMASTNYGTKGTGWKDSDKPVSFADKLPHDATFTITAAEKKGDYILSLFMDTSKEISTQTITWDSAMVDKVITGVGLRSDFFALSNLNVTWTHFAVVPEPATWVLLGTGVALLSFLRRRKS